MYRTVQKIVEILSGEWMLTWLDKANGGTIIFFRSFITSVIIFLVSIALLNLIDPLKGLEFSIDVFREQVLERFTWFGAIFVAVYLALYSRFASQWIYLSGLYNSIKQSEVSAKSENSHKQALADWKAGFIEDAECLHMAKKRSIAPIIRAWEKDEDVKKSFSENTPGGNERLIALMKGVNETCDFIESKYKNSA